MDSIKGAGHFISEKWKGVSDENKRNIAILVSVVAVVIIILGLHYLELYSEKMGQFRASYDEFRNARHKCGILESVPLYDRDAYQSALGDREFYGKLWVQCQDEAQSYLVSGITASIAGTLLLIAGAASLCKLKKLKKQDMTHDSTKDSKGIISRIKSSALFGKCKSQTGVTIVGVIGLALIAMAVICWLKFASSEAKLPKLDQLHEQYQRNIDSQIWNLNHLDPRPSNYNSLLNEIFRKGDVLTREIAQEKIDAYNSIFTYVVSASIGTVGALAGLFLFSLALRASFNKIPIQKGPKNLVQ